MQWKGRRESGNVEDIRGSGGGGKRGLALGGIGTIVVVVIGLLLGKNPMELLQAVNQGQPAQEQTAQPVNPADDEAASFVKVVLADNEDVSIKYLNNRACSIKSLSLFCFAMR